MISGSTIHVPWKTIQDFRSRKIGLMCTGVVIWRSVGGHGSLYKIVAIVVKIKLVIAFYGCVSCFATYLVDRFGWNRTLSILEIFSSIGVVSLVASSVLVVMFWFFAAKFANVTMSNVLAKFNWSKCISWLCKRNFTSCSEILSLLEVIFTTTNLYSTPSAPRM